MSQVDDEKDLAERPLTRADLDAFREEMRQEFATLSRTLLGQIPRRVLHHHDLMAAVRDKDRRSAADYARRTMWHLTATPNPPAVWERAMASVTLDGLCLEFGVFQGKSITWFANKRPDLHFHGFDSFEGLPEHWVPGRSAGHFDQKGAMPEVPANVTLHRGWFDDTAPAFAAEHPGEQLAFVHIDGDLYSSAKIVFDTFADAIVPGTIVLFDEYFNYPGWEDHEVKAWAEHVDRHAIAYEYLAFNNQGTQVLARVLERGSANPGVRVPR
ncbi:class I SAM-dependent methyltransferase [Acuticoccus sp.]|uniref:class I SAM-dependent methyltransferase n=1 Tax=Acuticoccus sp. TaxID=1904378 RepID=UPI003B520C06